jgi:hypothetical protein
MSLSFLAAGYEHVDHGGALRLFGVGQSARYNPIHESLLGQLSFDAILSSIDVWPSSVATANAILFANSSNVLPLNLGDFNGDFRQVVAQKNGAEDFANMPEYGFNDRTRSLLLVNTSRAPEFRVSFRDVFLDTWNQTIDAKLSGSQASRKGDPLMTWAAFPVATSYLSPDHIYLQITQSLNVSIDWWPDYDASFTYHLFLYLDGAHKLRGHCQRWSAWVEGGIKHDGIVSALWPKVVDGVSTIDQKLNDSLAALPSFKDFYYLPGRQLGPVSGVGQGNTWEDVTLVFEI